jgi:acetyl esterase/lipase
MKKCIGIGTAFVLSLSMIGGCGSTNETATTVAESVVESSVVEVVSDVLDVSVAGTYYFQESAMGGKLTVDWYLTLNEDGTYELKENGPMGESVFEGTYTADGEVVTTGPFDGTVEADFFEADNSCQWILDGENCTPANLGETSSEGMGAMKGLGGFDMAKTESDADYPNVSYASNSSSQVCDIYLPEGEGDFPVIILYHGGGFMFGDQNMDIIQPVISSALKHGYAVVSADYRKSSEAVFPAAVADAKAVVRFVKENAKEYGFDSERIAVWGESAGAYLATMTALTPGEEFLDGDVTDCNTQDESVKALVDFYGPIEFYTMDEEYTDMGQEENANHSKGSFECNFLGVDDMTADKDATYASYWETYAESVPKDIKVWIQTGTQDVQVPNTQSQNLAERLGKVIGTDNVSFSLIEGAGHEDDLFYTEENLEQVFDFLANAMK